MSPSHMAVPKLVLVIATRESSVCGRWKHQVLRTRASARRTGRSPGKGPLHLSQYFRHLHVKAFKSSPYPLFKIHVCWKTLSFQSTRLLSLWRSPRPSPGPASCSDWTLFSCHDPTPPLACRGPNLLAFGLQELHLTIMRFARSFKRKGRGGEGQKYGTTFCNTWHRHPGQPNPASNPCTMCWNDPMCAQFCLPNFVARNMLRCESNGSYNIPRALSATHYSEADDTNLRKPEPSGSARGDIAKVMRAMCMISNQTTSPVRPVCMKIPHADHRGCEPHTSRRSAVLLGLVRRSWFCGYNGQQLEGACF